MSANFPLTVDCELLILAGEKKKKETHRTSEFFLALPFRYVTVTSESRACVCSFLVWLSPKLNSAPLLKS